MEERMQGFGESQMEDFDYEFKAVLIGDSGVGKTSLISRWTRNHYNPNIQSTMSVEYCSKIVETETGKRTKVFLWDTCGQEKFGAISYSFYRGALGAFLIFDISSAKSFENVKEKWFNEIKSIRGDEILLMLVGNKSDKQFHREVDHNQASNWAEKEGRINYKYYQELDL